MDEPDDRLVGVIIKIRDRISEVNKAHEEQIQILKEQKQKLETELIRRLHERGATQTKTSKGTAYLGESMQASIADEGAFKRFCLEEQDLDFFQSRVMVAHLKEYMELNEGLLPPGVNVFREVTLNVRTPKKGAPSESTEHVSGAEQHPQE